MRILESLDTMVSAKGGCAAFSSRLFHVVLLGVMSVSIPDSLSAQVSQCPSDVKKIAGIYGYQVREQGHCEGLYAKEVAGTIILASFVRSFASYNLSGGDLTVTWTAPDNSEVI